MADEGGAIPRLHPADLEILADALRRGVAPGSPFVDAPPTIATGADVPVIRKVMREEIERNKAAIAGPDEIALRRIIQEEINRDREQNREACRRMVEDSVESGIDKEVRRIFADLDMPIDPDHVVATRKKLSGIFDMHEQAKGFKTDFIKEGLRAFAQWAIGIGGVALGYFFINRNGSGH